MTAPLPSPVRVFSAAAAGLQADMEGKLAASLGRDPTDVETLFSMYDASNTGLTPKQCREALNAIGLDQAAVNRAINALVRRGDYQETSQGRKLRRLK